MYYYLLNFFKLCMRYIETSLTTYSMQHNLHVGPYTYHTTETYRFHNYERLENEDR